MFSSSVCSAFLGVASLACGGSSGFSSATACFHKLKRLGLEPDLVSDSVVTGNDTVCARIIMRAANGSLAEAVPFPFADAAPFPFADSRDSDAGAGTVRIVIDWTLEGSGDSLEGGVKDSATGVTIFAGTVSCTGTSCAPSHVGDASCITASSVDLVSAGCAISAFVGVSAFVGDSERLTSASGFCSGAASAVAPEASCT